ncbi:hypothetical protein ABEG10_11725 [Burkholderia cenocepacia]|uniref:hypothetical protein n=1 Tax=Burkholderia cenocepacia TaxID=95486 RepID=UPI00209D6502|nr:hypothetical protein [Burkholderia cenocepacia]MCO8321140.1 hypothetical protein [Burkholderia cenocepacia]MCO8328600.1 hypothetical protein [Burkholderia cenocepacia]MCO8342995.1 hypothetical protein [Burkholderia cenocepacia]MCO8356277.1 hypothetical protein [Burkholderia cenocepacia]MCO8364797.1 hypothetical protein [Burkholderia cenocepacia]
MAFFFDVRYCFTLDNGEVIKGEDVIESPEIKWVFKIAEASARQRHGYRKDQFRLTAIIEREG